MLSVLTDVLFHPVYYDQTKKPHRVAITPPELRLEVGKTATLNCSVFGSPPGNVVWRKDMLTLLPSPRVIFPNPYLLQVRQIRRQDAGMYQCFVHREFYSSQASARIIIGGMFFFILFNK
ncbi:ig-like domain-containing protein [Caerostris extrusa]|uniref:Ig-like domain-containing protein n=1 Tax=Caerostris extrusa TaxID=172846 RepID=A0AAV4TSA2_CAEEX|nr:ig-like domain-containing protein [Caerostris extrusa]